MPALLRNVLSASCSAKISLRKRTTLSVAFATRDILWEVRRLGTGGATVAAAALIQLKSMLHPSATLRGRYHKCDETPRCPPQSERSEFPLPISEQEAP